MSYTFALPLTQLEGLYLSDSLSMFTQGPPDAPAGQGSPYPNLLLKIGSAVLESQRHGSPVTVHLSLSDLWTIREATKSSVVVGGERIGLNLLLKVYEGISVLTAEPDMESVVSEFGEVDDYEPGKSDYAAKLDSIRNGGNSDEGGKLNDDSSTSGDDQSGSSVQN